jgi:hypothetical protein
MNFCFYGQTGIRGVTLIETLYKKVPVNPKAVGAAKIAFFVVP